jgi:hypothetical protein
MKPSLRQTAHSQLTPGTGVSCRGQCSIADFNSAPRTNSMHGEVPAPKGRNIGIQKLLLVQQLWERRMYRCLLAAIVSDPWQTRTDFGDNRRIQAELSRIGFKISARTAAKYMQPKCRRGLPTTWRSFLRQNGPKDLGVRLLLRPDGHVSNGVGVFRYQYTSASSSRAGHVLSDRRVDSTTDY